MSFLLHLIAVKVIVAALSLNFQMFNHLENDHLCAYFESIILQLLLLLLYSVCICIRPSLSIRLHPLPAVFSIFLLCCGCIM